MNPCVFNTIMMRHRAKHRRAKEDVLSSLASAVSVFLNVDRRIASALSRDTGKSDCKSVKPKGVPSCLPDKTLTRWRLFRSSVIMLTQTVSSVHPCMLQPGTALTATNPLFSIPSAPMLLQRYEFQAQQLCGKPRHSWLILQGVENRFSRGRVMH